MEIEDKKQNLKVLEVEAKVKSYEEKVKKLQLTSDIFFGAVLGEEAVCQEVLKILTQQDVEVLDVRTQYAIRQLKNHSVILDVLAQMESGERVNVEMHPQGNEHRVKRMRYNFSSIDTDTFEVSETYADVPDVCGIYITQGDFLKTGKGVNKVVRYIEHTDVQVPNGVREYYINLNGSGDTAEQTALMRYMKNSDGVMESEMFPKLVKQVRWLKEEPEGREIMCEIMDEIREWGREEGRDNVICNMLENSMPVDIIARLAEVSEEVVLRIKGQMSV